MIAVLILNLQPLLTLFELVLFNFFDISKPPGLLKERLVRPITPEEEKKIPVGIQFCSNPSGGFRREIYVHRIVVVLSQMVPK